MLYHHWSSVVPDTFLHCHSFSRRHASIPVISGDTTIFCLKITFWAIRVNNRFRYYNDALYIAAKCWWISEKVTPGSEMQHLWGTGSATDSAVGTMPCSNSSASVFPVVAWSAKRRLGVDSLDPDIPRPTCLKSNLVTMFQLLAWFFCLTSAKLGARDSAGGCWWTIESMIIHTEAHVVRDHLKSHPQLEGICIFQVRK